MKNTNNTNGLKVGDPVRLVDGRRGGVVLGGVGTSRVTVSFGGKIVTVPAHAAFRPNAVRHSFGFDNN